MEVACDAGCALVPESVMLRLNTPGVTFRRLLTEVPVGWDGSRNLRGRWTLSWVPSSTHSVSHAASMGRIEPPTPSGSPRNRPTESRAAASPRRRTRRPPRHLSLTTHQQVPRSIPTVMSLLRRAVMSRLRRKLQLRIPDLRLRRRLQRFGTQRPDNRDGGELCRRCVAKERAHKNRHRRV